RTLCDLCKIYIRQAAANPSTSRDDVETGLEICDRIIVWTDQLVDAPRAVALLLYDLSVRFNDLAKIIYPQPQIDRLIRQAVAVVSSNCIPDVVKARFAEL